MTEALGVSALPQSWFRSQLREFCRIVSGATPKTSVSEFWGGPFPWVTPNDLSTHKAKVVVSGARSLTQAGYDSCSTRLVPAGSVLFTSRAPIGYVAIAGQSLCTNQGFKTAVPDGRIDSEYLYWHLQERTNSIRERASGTTFLEISAKGFGDTEINVPPLSEQRVIVDVLEGQFALLDAVLESVRRSRVEAVRLRRALLRDAFSGVLTHPDLGPGELPAGWGASCLGELVQFAPKPSASLVASGVEVSYVPMAKVSEVSGEIQCDETISATQGKKRSLTYFEDGDVIFAKITPCMENGKSAVAKGLTNGAAFGSSEFHVMRVLPQLLPSYLWFVLVHDDFRYLAERAMTGAVGQRRVPRSFIEDYALLLPPLSEQYEIVELLERELGLLDLAMKAADRIEMEAKSFRRSLLHSAFNGELTREWRENHG